MTDSWDEMRKAKEEQYFEKLNQETIHRLKNRPHATKRHCPIDSDVLEHQTHLGVIIDRCPKCGGVWVDNTEFQHLINAAELHHGSARNWLLDFFGPLLNNKIKS